jgi:hypothetical protein
MNRIPPIRTLASVCIVAVAAWAMAACAPDNPTLPPGAPPAHTVVKGGVAHMDGLYEPTNNCARCHGHSLEGGANGEPSCYECHDRVW